jgi:hypothetical protein
MADFIAPALVVAILVLLVWIAGYDARRYRRTFLAYIAQSDARFAQQMKAIEDQTKVLERIAAALERRTPS